MVIRKRNYPGGSKTLDLVDEVIGTGRKQTLRRSALRQGCYLRFPLIYNLNGGHLNGNISGSQNMWATGEL
jgi:hypothetical protein